MTLAKAGSGRREVGRLCRRLLLLRGRFGSEVSAVTDEDAVGTQHGKQGWHKGQRPQAWLDGKSATPSEVPASSWACVCLGFRADVWPGCKWELSACRHHLKPGGEIRSSRKQSSREA